MSLKERIKRNKGLYNLLVKLNNQYYDTKAYLSSPKERAFRRFKKENGEALRFRYKIADEDIVFDLGGYRGDWTAALPNPNCTVHLFEPVEAFARECEERFAGRQNIHCHAFGLDAQTHDSAISLAENASSQYESEGSTQVARFVGINQFMDQEGISEVKLMKMNIEGGEYDILEKLLEIGRVEQFENIQIQFHDIPSINAEARMKAIWKGLEKTHQLEWAYRPYIHESWKRRDRGIH